MKAVISNRIYMNCVKGSDLDAKLQNSLTYSISQEPISQFPLIIKNLVRVSDSVVSMPSGCTRYIPDEYEVVLKHRETKASIPKPSFVPREQQQACIDYIQGNGLINAPVGWGKSIAGLGVIHKLGEKALIITTTTTIRDMWVKEIKKWFGFTPGIIGGGKFNDKTPIVVGNIQTVRNRLTEIKDTFGTVLVDEVHRAPAQTFTKTLDALNAKHKIGLSGTLERKDGLHCVLEDYFGTDKFIGTVENVMEPQIHLFDTGHELNANEFIPWANKITALMSNQVYRNQVLHVALTYAEAGHKVLVLCDRTDLLEDLHGRSEDCSLLITGSVKGTELREQIMQYVSDADGGIILFATQSIFSEGVSLNELSAVVLATPIGNNEPLLVQIIGRIMRLCDGKMSPVVADMGMSGNTGKRQRNARVKTYVEKGWKVQDMGRI